MTGAAAVVDEEDGLVDPIAVVAAAQDALGERVEEAVAAAEENLPLLRPLLVFLCSVAGGLGLVGFLTWAGHL